MVNKPIIPIKLNQNRIRDWWNLLSKDYQQKHQISVNHIHYGVHGPTEDQLNLIGDFKNKSILEIGCGGGQNSIFLARNGAKCTAIDISENQICYARELAIKYDVDINFYVMDALEIPESFDIKFDIVLGSAYAFDWIYQLDLLFQNVYKTMKRDGKFIFSKTHPFLNCFDWKSAPRKLKLKKSYFQTSLIDKKEKCHSDHEDVLMYYPKISDIIKLLSSADFTIQEMIEPEVSESNIGTGGSNWESGLYSLKIAENLPIIIIFVCKKN